MVNTFQPTFQIPTPFFPRLLSRSNPEKTRVTLPWPRLVSRSSNPNPGSIRKLGQLDTSVQVHSTERPKVRIRLLRKVKTRAF